MRYARAPAEQHGHVSRARIPAPGGDVSALSATPGLKFPRSSRLRKHSDFDAVYQKGRRQFSPNLTVFYLPRTDRLGPRVGLTVGRALGGAVVRNRIKRRLREAVRHCLAVVTAPVDVVINPKKAALQVEFASLVSELRRAFEAVQQKSAR